MRRETFPSRQWIRGRRRKNGSGGSGRRRECRRRRNICRGETLHGDPACRVRFLHSAAGFGPVNIAAGDSELEALEFGQMSEFLRIPAGFALTALHSARMPGLALYKRSLLYPAGSVLTAALVNTQQGIGVRMIPEI
ncbi:MAG: DUF4397 domain-containing protein [Lachnospiraceae bacterium]|nr:DUF4397 domain-containing protein [Lachnospiraceae bacterium]